MNNYTPIRKKGVTSTQKNIYKRLCTGRLSELVNRVKEKILHKHIIHEFNVYPNNLKINITTKEFIKTNNKGETSLYIYFYEDKYTYAHITMHLSETNFKESSPGPIHLTLTPYNEENKDYMLIYTNLNRNIMYYLKDGLLINKEANVEKILEDHPEFEIVLKIIKAYLSNDYKEPYSLIHCTASNKVNNYTLKIIKNRKPSILPVPIPRTNKTYKHISRIINKKKADTYELNFNNNSNVISLKNNNFTETIPYNKKNHTENIVPIQNYARSRKTPRTLFAIHKKHD